MTSKIDPTLSVERLQVMTEGQYFDRKSARLQEKELARHISAMANAGGGVIVLGIEDNGEISGIDEKRENDFRKVPSSLLQMSPAIRVERLSASPDKSVLLFHISPSPNVIIKRTNGDAFLRTGDSSRQLTSQELLELEYSRGIRSFEGTVVTEVSTDDLDWELVAD